MNSCRWHGLAQRIARAHSNTDRGGLGYATLSNYSTTGMIYCYELIPGFAFNLFKRVMHSLYNKHICNNYGVVLYLENPSCLQATFASTALQWSSHTVPHCLFKQTSTRPWYDSDVKPESLIEPSVQAVNNESTQVSKLKSPTNAPKR